MDKNKQKKLVNDLILQLSEALVCAEAYAGEQTATIQGIIIESNKICKKLGLGEPFEIDESSY